MATSTYNWQRESYTDSVDGLTATRVWVVEDAQTPAQALNATPMPDTPPIAQINESHPDATSLLCRSRNLTRTGFYTYEVTANFGIPPGGGMYVVEKPSDPLQQLPSYTWSDGMMELPTDRDIRGTPRINSAGSAFDPPASQRIPVKYLTATLWKTGYDWNTYRQFEDTINDKEVKSGLVTFYPGEILCTSITPASGYSDGKAVMPIAFNFSIIRVYKFENNVAKRVEWPWQAIGALRDQGTEAWALVDGVKKQGKLCRSDASDATLLTEVDAQPFDGKGMPFDTTLKVNVAGTAYAIAAPPKTFVAPEYISPLSTATNTVLWWYDFIQKDHNLLGVF